VAARYFSGGWVDDGPRITKFLRILKIIGASKFGYFRCALRATISFPLYYNRIYLIRLFSARLILYIANFPPYLMAFQIISIKIDNDNRTKIHPLQLILISYHFHANFIKFYQNKTSSRTLRT
jgi:hypothetical protein